MVVLLVRVHAEGQQPLHHWRMTTFDGVHKCRFAAPPTVCAVSSSAKESRGLIQVTNLQAKKPGCSLPIVAGFDVSAVFDAIANVFDSRRSHRFPVCRHPPITSP